MGTGIWAMHFVGMLAMKMPIALSYNPGITTLSGAIAVLASALALHIISPTHLAPRRLFGGGVAMGAAICGMHYTGMAAIPVSPAISYSYVLVAASAAIAIVASTIALWLVFVLCRRKSKNILWLQVGASLIMGVAICGMHYTGMAAAHFVDTSICSTAVTLEKMTLVYGIILTTTLMLSSAIALSVLDAHLVEHRRIATTLTRENEQLFELAHHDHLTGLANRSKLKEHLTNAIHVARRRGRELAVLFLDLDGFKQVNDAAGHGVGDILLKEIGNRLVLAVAPAHGFVARVSGDEFVIVMDGKLGPRLDEQCQAILAAVRQPFPFASDIYEVTASIGGALYPVHGVDARSLMNHADGAMYAAKRSGKNAVLFSENASVRKTAMASDLARAIQTGEFELFYQPIVDAATQQTHGAEALVRWNHPQRGLLTPGDFVPAAEELGLIHSLGDWILDEACSRLAQWQSTGLGYTMSVNLSAVQLQDESFPARVEAILKRHTIAPGHLIFEVTETFAIGRMDACAQALQALHVLGVIVAMDDFGTGYSSLSHLHRLPVGELKIDRSFIKGLPQDKDAFRICEAIVALAHSLKIQVVAEGVETLEQHHAVTQLGCDRLQGYFFAKPMSWADFSAYAERNRPHTPNAGPVWLAA